MKEYLSKKMEAKLNHDKPEKLEAKRIAEIKSLSYVERLERLMAIIELSYTLKNATKIYSLKK
ncbi:hypothetical protein [Flavobacterium aquaticum]|nr:hypothetical protein [Flavobacterium aquaticum]